MLGTFVLLGLVLPCQCSHWIYPYNLGRSLFMLIFHLPGGLGCSGLCDQVGWVRTVLPELQLQPWKGWFEPSTSGCCWAMSDLPGNGHSGSGFPKGRKCPPGLPGVPGTERGRRCWVLLFSCRTHPQIPAAPREELLVWPLRSPAPSPPFPGQQCWKPLALFPCREMGAVLFSLLDHGFQGRKNIFLALKPLCSTRLEKQDEVWDAIRALGSCTAPVPLRHRR